MANELDDVFEDSPLDAGSSDREPEPQETQATEPETTEDPASEGTEAPADESAEQSGDKEEVETPPVQQESMVPLAALQDERDRRQMAERHAQQLQQEQMENLRRQNQQLAQQRPEEVNPFDDPDAYERQLYEQRLAQQVDDRMFNALSNMSVYQAQQRHEDYGEKEQLFTRLAEANPGLAQQMRAHPDPAEFAYQTASQYLMLQEVGKDPAAYEEKVREKVKAELLAEQGTAAEPSSGQREIPPTLVNERSTQTKREPAWAGPEPLDTIFPENW